MSATLSRRNLLKGLGALVALPYLEGLAVAAAPATTGKAAVAGAAKRVAFLYVPNGMHMPDWLPGKEGALGTLPDILKPLTDYKEYLNVFSGLTLDKARPNGDGAGDHARAMAAFLTGRQPRKTHGADIRVGQSADQHIAGVIGEKTRFASLELGIERGAQAGNCDSGYSCAYSSNLSWRSENTPNAKETDPKAVFERLFGTDNSKEAQAAKAKRDAYNQSVLDYVMEDAKTLNKTLGSGDLRKVDEYLTSVREVEQRIQRMAKESKEEKPKKPTPEFKVPLVNPKEFDEHVRIMGDLMVLAFQTDTTRVVTFPLANDGSNRPYKSIDVPEGHHDLSHHGKSDEKQAKLKKINTYHIEQLAYILGKMKAVKEANNKTLLDNVMMVYGSGIGDGDRHNHDDLPILLLGKGGGTITGGRHTKVRADTPLMNLYLSLFERMDAPTKSFGDSTGVLKLS
jgi:hypothetical protein